jgi:ribosome-associated translation inhibitor RaiA
MKLSITYKMKERQDSVEKEIHKRVLKVEKLLTHYAPDLIQLHCTMRTMPRRQGYIFILNLSLPTGTLHATAEGADTADSIKVGFAEVETQVKKHLSLLRKDYKWKRKRPRAGLPAEA